MSREAREPASRSGRESVRPVRRRRDRNADLPFRLFVESVQDYAIFMLDPDGRIVSWNRGAERMKGYAEDEVLGKHFSVFYPRDRVLEGYPDYELRVAAQRGSFEDEGWRVRKDGGRFWAHVVITAVRDDDGRLLGFGKVTRDLSERREMEAARLEAERRAREEAALREATAAVSAAFTVEETVEQIAKSALRATRSDGALVTRIDARAGEIEIAAVAGDRGPERGRRIDYAGSLTEYVIQREEPELVPRLSGIDHGLPEPLEGVCDDCSAAVVPLINAGEPVGALVLLREPDKPAFRADEVERAFTFGDLAALALRRIHLLEESERRRAEIERITESRARLMRGFGHDVKNPLGAADGHLQLLEEGVVDGLTEKQRDSIGRARRSLRAALELIDTLLEIARAEAGEIETEPAPTDVRQAAREISEEYRVHAESKGLELVLDLPDELPIIESDSARIRQILSNLLSNALKFTRHGRVLVRVDVRDGPSGDDGRWIAVDVSDTGPGIPEDEQRRLFEEFQRLDPDTQGTGVGLAISQRVAHALGGIITVESAPGEGSTFTFWLPLDRV